MDDLSSKLNEIFSSPDGMEKIKNLVSMLQNSGGGQTASQAARPPQPDASQPGTDTAPPPPPPASGAGGLNFDPSMLLTMQKAFSAMQKGDPRVDLLLALRENLGDERRQRVDEAVQILRMMNLLPLLREQGLFGGGDNGPQSAAK